MWLSPSSDWYPCFKLWILLFTLPPLSFLLGRGFKFNLNALNYFPFPNTSYTYEESVNALKAFEATMMMILVWIIHLVTEQRGVRVEKFGKQSSNSTRVSYVLVLTLTPIYGLNSRVHQVLKLWMTAILREKQI